jgi:hypothetical protein
MAATSQQFPTAVGRQAGVATAEDFTGANAPFWKLPLPDAGNSSNVLGDFLKNNAKLPCMC